MKPLQRPWLWPWATLSVVALFGLAAMLGIELGLIVLIFAGLIALVTLRQNREMAVTLPANAGAGYVSKGGERDDTFPKQQDSCLAP